MKSKLHIGILAILSVGVFYAGWYMHQPSQISQLGTDSIRNPALDELYKQYGCDSAENSGRFNDCVANVYKTLSDQQASKYQEFLNKLDNWPDTLCPSYSTDLMKDAVTQWYRQDKGYISARCSVESEITGSVSTDIITVCKLEHAISNVEFLQRLIDESHGYAPVNGSCG